MEKIKDNIIYICLAVLMLLSASTKPVISLRGYFQSWLSPFTKKVYQLDNKGSAFSTTLSQIKDLASQNTTLKKENEVLKARVSELEEIKFRVETLEKEIEFKNIYNQKQFIAGVIISRNPSSYRNIISVDKGTQDGVKINQGVISNGYLIGKISETFPTSSQIELITSHRFIAPILLQGSRQLGLLKGGLKGVTIEQLPIGMSVKEGEEVVTSGLAGELPSGIPVGTIDKVISKPSDIFLTASLKIPVEISKIELVLIITDQNE